jgi:hypothetical protein
MKQRLNADLINASAEVIIFEFSHNGKKSPESDPVNACLARVYGNAVAKINFHFWYIVR